MEPALSVVIPTRDRADVLARTVRALREQAADAEVIVVDNGSRDGSLEILRAEEHRPGLPFRWDVERSPGPAAARNAAVRIARGRQLLFLGDDTRPATGDLLARHVALVAGATEPMGVLGRIEWEPGTASTFMDWLSRSGAQFAFDRISAGPTDAAAFLYTSHVSVPRELLVRVGGFDERFTSAAFEDVELGGRLAAAGLRLVHDPELVVYHDHPTDYATSLRRMRRVGAAAYVYRTTVGGPSSVDVGDPGGLRGSLVAVAATLVGWRRALTGLPPGARDLRWKLAHRHAFGRGYAAESRGRS